MAHALSIQCSGVQVRLSWPATGSNFVLESTSTLEAGKGWQAVPQAPILEQPIFQVGEWVVKDRVTSDPQFYRLRRR
jgi:hypothetical protein